MERIMVHALKLSSAIAIAAACTALGLADARKTFAQPAGQPVSALGMYSLPLHAAAAIPPAAGDRYESPAGTGGPLARLVRNPQQFDGLPPFALADQSGRIQRYVEPVPGIDLQPYVGQVVVVRHDTGRILLASQLELPPQPMVPLLDDVGSKKYRPSGRASSVGDVARGQGDVAAAQFVDEDDMSVQLLPEGDDASNGDPGQPVREADELSDASGSEPSAGEFPAFPLPMTRGDAEFEELPMDPLLHGVHGGRPHAFGSFPQDDYGWEPCPECGGYHTSSGCRPYVVHGDEWEHRTAHKPCRLFGAVELNFLRTHLPQTSMGKLSEKYELSPRLIIGFRDTGLVDGRVRYWSYGRDTRVLSGGAIRADFDVFDLEGTHTVAGRRSEITVGAGFRLASIDLTDVDGLTGGSDLIGMTLSADGRVPLRKVHGCLVSAVYGGRLSILGGDWGGPPGNDFTGGLAQDDNVVVHELNGGLDMATRYRGIDVHARLGFELQNWHSDALSQNAGTDSVGFIGPGLQLGAEF